MLRELVSGCEPVTFVLKRPNLNLLSKRQPHISAMRPWQE